MESAIIKDPFLVAKNHLLELTRRFPPETVPIQVIENLASVHPEWPVWPNVALSDLVGPPNVALKKLDLRWLHRFRATIGLLGWLSAQLGGPKGGPSALSLIVERAPLLGLRGWGSTSAGGSCRILATADVPIAVNLPRVDDQLSVPAWLDSPVEGNDWDSIKEAVIKIGSGELADRGGLLGIPVSLVGETQPSSTQEDIFGEEVKFKGPPVVVDLSSMWAGPLCSWYLMRCGARVVKIESSRRDGGTRKGSDIFHQRLNKGKDVISLDFNNPEDIHQLRSFIRGADIVIEGSRPRALEQLGIDAMEEVARGAIWCSVTGYGRFSAPHRVGFGDDAAAGANLLAEVDGALWFIGDAIADPITGATAAVLTMGHWLAHSSVLLDVGLSPTTAVHSQGTLSAGSFFNLQKKQAR